MRRYLVMIFILIATIACWGITRPLVLPAPTSTLILPSSTTTAVPPSPLPAHTSTATQTPPVEITTPAASLTPTYSSQLFTVHYHPDDALYVGDQVSIEVVSPPNEDMRDAKLQVQVDPPGGKKFEPVNFSAWGIQGRNEAALLWAWDTRDEAPGTHTLAFSVQPHGYTWAEQVSLLPASDLPVNQAAAQWESTQTQCCTVFYITSTASERDLSVLTSQIDEQARLSMDEMGANFTQPITITILPRMLGHGGFTSNEISVSYLDRNYAANSWAMVVHHEMIHAIDGQAGGDFRPTIFVEGLAVYMAGGHYKPEPLMPRAAALLENNLDWYIPLDDLANDFYASQHEIGYMEGASLIEYMVKTYGWEAFSAFYRDIHIKEGESQSESIDAALKVHFSIAFKELEQDYLAALAAQPDTQAWVDDVRLTVTYFDIMRRYQQLLDPSAYFRTAWLLDNNAMRSRGIVADYLRHPHTPENLALETLFITAGQHMADEQYSQASQVLEKINSVLDGIEQGSTNPFSTFDLTADFLSIATMLQNQGYEVQNIKIDGDLAQARVTTASGPDLIPIRLTRSDSEWSVSP